MLPSHHFQPSRKVTVFQNVNSPPVADLNLVMVSNKKLENINCIIQPTQSLGGLYLGDIISTLKPQLLKANSIRAILSCMCERTSINALVKYHKTYPIKDILQYPIIQHFDDAFAWINQKRKQKCNVLVHCHAGVSRSATIVVAYLIRTEGWNPVQALEFVKQKRERAKPNISFWNQINEYYAYWSKQKQLNIQSQSIMNKAKQNLSLHSNFKTNVIIQRVQYNDSPLIKKEEKRQQIDPLNLKIGNNIPDKNEVQRSSDLKFPISLRKKLFQKRNLEKSMIIKTKRDEIISEYSNQNMDKLAITQRANHLYHSSILNKEPYLTDNKSSIHTKNQNTPQSNQERSYNSPSISFKDQTANISSFEVHPTVRFN